MAKIRGPLMSLRASGSIAGIMTFRHTGTGPRVTRPAIPSGIASPFQLQQRADFANASTAWANLAQAERVDWIAAAATFNVGARNLYISEWLVQRASPERLPLCPAPRL